MEIFILFAALAAGAMSLSFSKKGIGYFLLAVLAVNIAKIELESIWSIDRMLAALLAAAIVVLGGVVVSRAKKILKKQQA